MLAESLTTALVDEVVSLTNAERDLNDLSRSVSAQAFLDPTSESFKKHRDDVKHKIIAHSAMASKLKNEIVDRFASKPKLDSS